MDLQDQLKQPRSQTHSEEAIEEVAHELYVQRKNL
jgi:hypothetical protein